MGKEALQGVGGNWGQGSYATVRNKPESAKHSISQDVGSVLTRMRESGSKFLSSANAQLNFPRRYTYFILGCSELVKISQIFTGALGILPVCASSIPDLLGFAPTDSEKPAASSSSSSSSSSSLLKPQTTPSLQNIKANARFFMTSLQKGGLALSKAYAHFLEVREEGQLSMIVNEKNPPIASVFMIEQNVLIPLVSIAKNQVASDSLLSSQVGSRGMYFISAVIVVIVRLVFAAVGAIAGALSFIYPYQVLVKTAFEGLSVGLIARDVGFCFIKFINPKFKIRLPLNDLIFYRETGSSSYGESDGTEFIKPDSELNFNQFDQRQ